LPLFITQFLGAFNDNLIRNSFLMLVTYQIAAENSAQAAFLVNLATGLFVLPMFLFSPIAGQLADKIDRSKIARIVKLAEIALAVIGGAGLFLKSTSLLLLTLFGFGTHSTFFGPVKYAILPQHLAENELLEGNAYVDASTFLAILIGTIAGAKMVLISGGLTFVTVMLLLIASAGYASSRQIPAAPPPAADLKLSFHLYRDIKYLIQHTRKQQDVFLSIIGISWFWFVGAIFLVQFPPFTKDVLGADENVGALFLAMFAIGIGAGSILCSKLMKGLVHVKYVPLAAIGMSLFSYRLYASGSAQVPAIHSGLINIYSFLRQPEGWRILLDLFALALCGGFYSVPLYTLLQQRAEKTHCARAIACNNLMNALFMVIASLLAIGLLELKFTIPHIFLTVAILNSAAACYICRLLPFSVADAVLKLLRFK
jgi:acyl-[acyl-carrier-protein]-phospholipid O-acyltransferase / long-chain-fatty-acid--[acyl-carrier-protein] ligase